MHLSRLTFFLASLVVLIALIVMPAMAQDMTV